MNWQKFHIVLYLFSFLQVGISLSEVFKVHLVVLSPNTPPPQKKKKSWLRYCTHTHTKQFTSDFFFFKECLVIIPVSIIITVSTFQEQLMGHIHSVYARFIQSPFKTVLHSKENNLIFMVYESACLMNLLCSTLYKLWALCSLRGKTLLFAFSSSRRNL